MTRANPSSTLANQPGSNSTATQLVVPTRPEWGISQELLGVFQELREVKRETSRIRQILLDRIEAGERVEPGPLFIELRNCNSQRLSWPILEDMFGAEFVERLRDQIPVSTNRVIILRRRS